MSGKPFTPTSIDQHIGHRMQLRRTIMGMSLKDLAAATGVTFQQIQKYENAENRVAASRLFQIGVAMQTPVSFFFQGLPGNMPDETKANRSMRVHQPDEPDDPILRTESLTLIKLYWRLNPTQRASIIELLKSFSGASEN